MQAPSTPPPPGGGGARGGGSGSGGNGVGRREDLRPAAPAESAPPSPTPPPTPAAPAGGATGAGRPSAFELDIGGIMAKSTVMAVVFAAPPLCIFLGLHHYTGSVLAAAAVGFGAHFVILAFSQRIADLLIAGGGRNAGGRRQ